MLNLLSAIGLAGLCFVAWLGSEDRRIVSWNTIAWGIGLQLVVGGIVFGIGSDVVVWINDLLNVLLDASEAGARFLFGGESSPFVPDPARRPGPGVAGRWLVRTLGDPYVNVPGDRLGPDNLNPGFILAFRSLPQVIFFSGLVSLLYRLNIIQPIIKVFAKVFRKTLKISGAESLAGAANIFVGVESAIAIKPFLPKMSRSELCAILASCFGSIASSVLALYAGLLRPTFPTITGHLVSASIMTIPACFVLSKLLVPETTTPETFGHIPEAEEDPDQEKPNPVDSLIIGALDGVRMAVGIAAVIIAILGLVALVNEFFSFLTQLPGVFGDIFGVITLQNLLGAIFLPLTFLTGISLPIPFTDAFEENWQVLWESSVIIGRRLFETNIPPYISLAQLARSGVLTPRALLIVSYVLCGFTHFASYGIFVGGLSALVPSRRSDISALGFKALWAATLATLMTGCIAGLFFTGNTDSILGIPTP
ncbi:MAG: nucleoside transporter C-terminal domain-containing protein [Sodalinema sp.]|uniref:NupC/NupG family nucleoside CNT transporter n=1 Tax=Sodalinema sp. TaxID=3080550 RepID=UPI00122AB6DE|nr:MAG: nucleoside:proton symporter [Phormidium sp. SL48-SHIP]